MYIATDPRVAAAVRTKAVAETVSLPDDVALSIASSIKSNVRKLDGALIRLTAHALLSHYAWCLNVAGGMPVDESRLEHIDDSLGADRALARPAPRVRGSWHGRPRRGTAQSVAR